MKSILHYPGSKKRIAPWIIENMPEHHSYLEPYFGGGAVLFEKEPSKIETINDLDGEVVNFFRVIRERTEELIREVVYTPYAREEYDRAYSKEIPRSDVERALHFAIKSLMGHGFRTCEKTGWKKDVYGREAAYTVKHWNNLPEAIEEAATRLKYVQIENRPALDLIKAFDHDNVLMYIDPPYVLSTRGRRQYRFEMENQDHEKLLQVVTRSSAKVMLSGYDNDLYNDYLSEWRKEQIPARAQNSMPRTETLWMNY